MMYVYIYNMNENVKNLQVCHATTAGIKNIEISNYEYYTFITFSFMWCA